jgi:coenzyme F420-reducing hydrogenase alpha subunit
MTRPRTVKVDLLTRVEGEGGIYLRLEGRDVTDVRLRIFEPPRLFEAFLRGRHFTEVPDLVARICGICPVAYQMSAVHALEAILGLEVHPAIRALRRLLYCAEWIESHALHIHMLHAPDFLDYPDALAMARDHPETVAHGLEIKKTGNELMTLLGGREIHPVSVAVGGFYRVPDPGVLRAFVPRLRRARDLAIETALWARALSFPDFEQDYEFVALQHPGEYPLNDGRVVSSKGLDIAAADYEEHFVERHVPYANALQSSIRSRGAYHVGPLARYNLNFDRLTPEVRDLARECGVLPPVINPFKSIVVRALEMVWACEEAIRISESCEPPSVPRVVAAPRAGVGQACTEAPRGLLYHRYELDAAGCVVAARIVPPTAQNQRQMEEDLLRLAPRFATAPLDELTRRCEQSVRNYDPCISCATHALKVTIDRR